MGVGQPLKFPGVNFDKRLSMKLAVVLLALLLGACATTKPIYWNKPGGTQDELRRDKTECEVAAVRDVPVLERKSSIVAPTTNCSGGYFGSVSCTTNPGVSYTSDENANLRKRAYMVCLERRGWTASFESKRRVTSVPASKQSLPYSNIHSCTAGFVWQSGSCVVDFKSQRK